MDGKKRGNFGSGERWVMETLIPGSNGRSRRRVDAKWQSRVAAVLGLIWVTDGVIF
jgi:hypothetical protein